MGKPTILVTGSAGFMGSHLCDYLSKKGHQVHGVDDLSGGFQYNVSSSQLFTQLDLRDRKRTALYIQDLAPDIIFHLAADATEGRSQFTPFSAIDRNLNAYMNLLIPAIKSGFKKMILTSSMSVYGNQEVPFHETMSPKPEDIYGISKASMEMVTQVQSQVFGFLYVIIRPHNVYGPRQNLKDPYRNVMGIFINRLLNGKGFYIYGDGQQKRAFSYIDDVIDAIARSGFSIDCEGKIINIGSEEIVTLNKLSQIILEEFFFGQSIPTSCRPTYVTDRPKEVKFAYSNHELAKNLLNFDPKISIRDGLKKMISWAKVMGAQEFTYLDSLDLENETTPETWSKRLI